MAPSYEEDESDSGNSDNDDNMDVDDVDDGDEGDADGDDDGDDDDVEADEEGDDAGEGEGADDEDDAEDNADLDIDGEDNANEDDEDDQDAPESPSPVGAPGSSTSHPINYAEPTRPEIRPEMITAETYDIVPTMAAPQSTSINALCTTLDMRWVFTGGSDGYIRKYNWFETANGKLPLTVAQKHPFVDSVTKAGVLQSYWENEDTGTSEVNTPPRSFDEAVPVSPVYSLAVHHQALWLLSGDEIGNINLQSVRHSEGTRIHTLKKHTSAVSVLSLAPDERSVLSGSWDKMIYDWSLDTGDIIRTYKGGAGQISTIAPRPTSSLPVPNDTLTLPDDSETFSSNNAVKTQPSNSFFTTNTEDHNGTSGGNDGDLDSLFGDDGPGIGVLGDDDLENDVLSRAMQQASEIGDPQDDLFGPDINEPVKIPDETVVPSEPSPKSQAKDSPSTTKPDQSNETNSIPESAQTALPHSEEPLTITQDTSAMDVDQSQPTTSESTFLDAAIDGTMRVWDRRQPNPIARIPLPRNTPPWCMSACWSPDGNSIYAGRRNNAVDEYSLVKGLREPTRTYKFPNGSGAVSAVYPMPNGRHLICASYDILRLYDLQAPMQTKHTHVPFLILPGHRTGVISQLLLDPTCSFLISTAGNRGWEGASTEVMLGYEITIPQTNA